MSREYRPISAILMSELFDGRLARFGISEYAPRRVSDPRRRTLTDGQNCLSVYGHEYVENMETGGCNDEGKILSAITEAFGATIATEDDPRFWGFETEEDMARASKEGRDEQRKAEATRLAEIIKYAKGAPNSLKPGSAELLMGDIAKCLFEYNPEIVSAPKHFEEFLVAVSKVAHATDDLLF